MKGDGYDATCEIIDGEFVVRQGSIARIQQAPTMNPSTIAKKKELITSGILKEEKNGLRFTQDYAFGSSSGAAGLIAGASVNGKLYWHLPDGRTLKAIQESSELAATD